MKSNVSDLFLFHTTTFDLWEGVQTMYGQQNNISHIYRLRQEIQQEQQDSRTNTQYFGALKKKADELKTYRPPTTDPMILQNRVEEDEIIQSLSSINPSYEALRS